MILKIKWNYELTIFAILLAVVPVIIISLSLINKTEEELTQSINSNLTNLANQAAEEINSFFVGHIEKQFLIKKSLEDESLGVDEKIALLVSTVANIDQLVSTTLLFKESEGFKVAVQSQKKVIDSLISENHPELFDRIKNSDKAAEKLIQRKSKFGSPFYISSLDRWYIYSIINVEFDQTPDAYLVSLIDLSLLYDKLKSSKYLEMKELIVINNDGESIFNSSDLLEDKDILFDVDEILHNKSRVTEVTNYSNGEDKYVVSIAFPENIHWAVIAVEDYNLAYILVSDMKLTMFLWIALGVILAVSAAFLIIKRIRRPIDNLVEKAEQVSRGDFDIKIDYNIEDSIGTLGSTMELMSKSLKESFNQIEKQNKELEEYSHTLEDKVKERTKRLKETNNDLQKAYLKVLELNNEKNEFLGIAAHDLKNPLSAIKGFGMIINEDELEKEELKDFAQRIIESSDRMFDIIVSLLDINRIEEGRIEVKYEMTSVNSMIQSLVRQNSENATKKEINILVNNLNNDIEIETDEALVLQVLDNFLSNAVKFSPKGKSVEITAVNNSDTISIAVKDNGPGLNDEDKLKLFQKFKKLSARPTAGENSTGLGLSIAKKITELLGGDIVVTSQKGNGAEFKMIIPKA